ncbi:hypothetical protein ACIQVR_41760 [Streptomyces xanthochromogenes]|uniref:hypothetical protein n=1 Tax=Streptomyces xanthochromogenes TaxID=67384 RepID=UPI00382BCFA6
MSDIPASEAERPPEPERLREAAPVPAAVPGAVPGAVRGTVPKPTPMPPPTPDITYTQCKRCGTELAGLDGRYSCGVCGWSNHWSEGHRPLPRAEDDPDAPPTPVNPLGEQ